MAIIAKHVVFSGRVQGVGFRFTALNVANRYHLTGYVCNLPNGAVEMLAQGPEEIVDSCVGDIRDSFAGCVLQVDIEAVTVDQKLKDFKITF
jgi:acylphosphatase